MIEQSQWGGRQHILRWQAPHTWQYYESAGLDYDSSVYYAECPGFRCGTCQNFPVFNLLTREELSLLETPLIAMEFSLLDERYLNLEPNQAWAVLKRLIDCCNLFKGSFGLLWHNNRLVNQEEVAIYERAVRYCASILADTQPGEGDVINWQ